MRGLGIGIVVTALIMGIATKDGQPLTDAEIKAAAAKLGMVESDSLKLSDLLLNEGKADEHQTDNPVGSEPAASPVPESETPTPESTEGTEELGPSSAPEGTEEPEPSSAPEETEEPEPLSGPAADGSGPKTDPAPTAKTTPPPSQAPAPLQSPASVQEPEAAVDTETVKFIIKSGTGSRTVCNQLAEAGLIEDAAAFDQYLCDNSYARRVCAGTFEIPKGASEEQIAKIITKSR